MSSLEIKLETLYKYIKLRFLIISLVLIVLVILLPYSVPINAEFEPVYSVYSDGNYGRSSLQDILDGYTIDREYLGDATAFDRADLLIIMSPQNNYPTSYINKILNAYHQGTKVLLVGTTGIQQITRSFGVDLASDPTGEDRIFDDVNNGGDIVYPALDGYGMGEIFGVVPTEIHNVPVGANILQTKSTSGFASCYDSENDPCLRNRVIGAIRQDFGVIADDWMFTNQYLEQFPGNKELFSTIVEDLIGESGDIVFDETFLEWAPLNQKGVENFVEIQLDVSLIISILAVLTIIIPILVGFQANIFDRTIIQQSQANEVHERLSYIHVERLPVAPLNIMEEILMEEKLQFDERRKFYFQYAASEILHAIDNYEILKQFPNKLHSQLQHLRDGLYDKESSWRVLESSYKIILSIITPDREYR